MIDYDNNYMKFELKRCHIPIQCQDCKYLVYVYRNIPSTAHDGFFYCRNSGNILNYLEIVKQHINPCNDYEQSILKNIKEAVQ